MIIDPKDYKKIVELMPIMVIDYLIYENDKSNNILLVKRNNEPLKDQWWVPGGRIFKNESVNKSSKRILRKETGIIKSDLKYLNFIGYYEAQYPKSEWDTDTHTISLIFEGTLKSELTPIVLDNQSSKYKFGPPPDDLMEFLISSGINNL